MDLKINENVIRECIVDCTFDKLQKNEIKETKNSDIKTMKFRKGLFGSFNNDLNEKDLVKINNKIRDNLNYDFKKSLNLINI